MDPQCPHCDNPTPHRIEKYCPQCDKTLPHTSYHKNRSAPDGLSAYCKACRSAKGKTPEQRAKNATYMRGWNGQHREHINANAMEDYWEKQAKRQDDPELDEHCRKLQRGRNVRFHAKHPERVKASQTTYNANNKPKINQSRRNRYAKDPRKVRAQLAKRYALRRNAPINDLTAEDWEAIKAHYGYRCVYCPATCQECRKGTHELTREHSDTALLGRPKHTEQRCPSMP